MKALLADLRKRNVFRVAGVYSIAAWIIMQLVDVLMSALELPSWVDGFVLLLLVAGFLLALVFAWMFELGPDGIVRTDPTAAPSETGGRRTDYAIVAALVALVVVSIVQTVRAPAPTADAAATDRGAPGLSEADAPAPAAASASIAVLPFANLSADPAEEYFSDGLTEELMTQLARFDGLQIAARTSSFAFKGRNEDLREIGRQLNVAHLLEGSVRRAGDQLRVTAQLVNAQTGYQLWSKSFDAELVDVFAIQEQIATAVAEALSVALRVGLITRIEGGTTNVEAYDRYLQGRNLLNRGASPEDFVRAADEFRAAVALDPGFEVARANYALTLARSLIFVPEQTAQTVAELEAVVATALERAPNHWSGHLANLLVASQRHDWAAVYAGYGALRNLPPPPDGSAASSLAVVISSMGHTTEAIRALQVARRADPLSLDVAGMLQQQLFIAGRAAEAQAEYERTLEFPGQRDTVEHVALMSIWDSGDLARIEAQYRRFLRYQTIAMPVLDEVAGALDDHAAARALLARAFQDPAYQDPSRMMILAWHSAHFGDDATAGAALRRAFVDMDGTYLPALWFPALARYRATPEFKQLVRDLKLVDYWRSTGNWGDYCRPLGADDFDCAAH
jgi:TolB-like protein